MKIKSAVLLLINLLTIASKAMNEKAKASDNTFGNSRNNSAASANNESGSVDSKENANGKKDNSCTASSTYGENQLKALEEIICAEHNKEDSKSSVKGAQEEVCNKPAHESQKTATAQEISQTIDDFKDSLESASKYTPAETIRSMSVDCLKKALKNQEIDSVVDDKVFALFVKKYGCKKAKIFVDKYEESCTNQSDSNVIDNSDASKAESFKKIIKIYETKSVILKISTLIFIASAVYLTDNLLSVHFKHSFKDKITKFAIPSFMLLFSGIMMYCSYINVDILHNIIGKYIN